MKLSQETENKISDMLCAMTVEEKVGQLFLARCPSYNAAEDAATYHLGGYVLFGRDFEDRSKEDVISDIASYQAAAKIPMLIAVDEEGGIVCRVSTYFRDTRFPAPRKLYDQGGLKLILATETEKIQLLQSFGINVNLAPVCDVTTDPDAFMYSRSLGQSPEETGRVIASMVNLMNRSSFGCVPIAIGEIAVSITSTPASTAFISVMEARPAV